jgi:hypothetical protein
MVKLLTMRISFLKLSVFSWKPHGKDHFVFGFEVNFLHHEQQICWYLVRVSVSQSPRIIHRRRRDLVRQETQREAYEEGDARGCGDESPGLCRPAG